MTAAELRSPSDLTDDEWAYVAPLIPPAKPGGNKSPPVTIPADILVEGKFF
jgi:transposase